MPDLGLPVRAGQAMICVDAVFGDVEIEKCRALCREVLFELRPCSRTEGYFTPVHERSIRLDQAPFLTQFRFALMSALASSMSFRMSAVRATFGGFPAFIMA